jgi:glycerol uptake facilitator-like aquaporin
MKVKDRGSPLAMTDFGLARRVAAEFGGTWLLVATIVGSGIMGADLAGGNSAVALLGNTLATGAILVVLIATLGPISGAHFNPAVSLIFLIARELPARVFAAYAPAQIAGGILGTLTAHAMFDLPVLQISATARHGFGQWLAEGVATFGLVATILGCRRMRPDLVPLAVGLFISAGYWFTASTSFANPAVALARSLTDTFSGIAPSDVSGFVLAELAGALLALPVMRWMLAAPSRA